MNIKGLLLGSAAALVAVSSARAADAIVIAEPEPMEYVRICDMYGAGYFYIPGTENCLKIGGYMRYEMLYDEFGGVDGGYSFTKMARFAPNFSVKNETEWGTLTGYAEVEFDWYSGVGFENPITGDVTIGSLTSINLLYAYISLETASGTFLVGKTENPYSRFLGFAGPTLFEGAYPYYASGEVSYTYTNQNGFSAILAAVEIETSDKFDVGIEGGFNFEKDWGSIGAIAGYDMDAESWGARAVGRFKVPSTEIEATLQGFYSSEDTPGIYHVYDPYGDVTEWSVLAGASVALNEKIGLAGSAQWFDTDAWQFIANVPFTPVDGFAVTPEVVYSTGDGQSDFWLGRVRFQRSF
ncbi:porin [Mesorhizobium sp. CAU 1732]|uniref:porin n=1 Tax=Mesorhizobium sp. CAU 1732 TaxID=3140358 RepID=UPI0032600C68